MDTTLKMKKAKIVRIIKIVFENLLLELYFNIERQNKKFSFKLSISDDGETILVNENTGWVELSEINYETYSAIEVNNANDELARLLDNEILSVHFGVGKALDTKNEVIYYVKINTNKNEFLFFNNGDQGAYSFDSIEKILANDIYGVEWSVLLPTFRSGS